MPSQNHFKRACLFLFSLICILGCGSLGEIIGNGVPTAQGNPVQTESAQPGAVPTDGAGSPGIVDSGIPEGSTNEAGVRSVVLTETMPLDVAYSPDGKYLAVGSVDKVKVFDANSLQAIWETNASGYRLAWSPDSTMLALRTHQQGVLVWNAGNGGLVGQLGESSINGYPSWSPDSSKIVYPEKLAEGLYVPAIWNIRTQAAEMNYQGYMNGTASSWSPDGNRLAFEAPSAILIWDFSANAMVNAGVLPDMVHTAGIRWSPDGKYLAVSTFSNTVVMDVSVPQSPAMPLKADPQNPSLTNGEVIAMAWSPDSTTLAVSQGTYVTLYNVATGLPDTANQPFSHPNSAAGVSFSPDGSTLATASGDGTVMFWPVKNMASTNEQPPSNSQSSGDTCVSNNAEEIVFTQPGIFCITYPSRFTVTENLRGTDRVGFYGPQSSDPAVMPAQLEIGYDVDPARGQTIEQYQEQLLLSYEMPGAPDVSATPITLGGEPAFILDGLNFDVPSRVIYVIHNDNHYGLSFKPYYESASSPDYTLLWNMVTTSFRWLSSE